MKFISWNVNGIRACITKGFEERFHELDADIFCLQETKCQQGQVKLELRKSQRLFRYSHFYEEGAVVCGLRDRDRGA